MQEAERMTIKRHHNEICLEILPVCLDGANVTRIVYRVILNFRTVLSHLTKLQGKGLIERSSRTYQTTQKGRQSMELCRPSELI
jgi:predicted transcriptional regulator